MRIKKLTLHKYRRFHMLGDDTIEYVSTEDFTTIRGVSGRGKSSFLYELSPLPPNMRMFAQGGYKEVTIEHNGKEYIINSSGENAGKHSFIVNGEELNPGKTQQVQYQLIEEHFNYNRNIHDVLIGTERFTQMSGNDRRKWFVSLSNTDHEFVTKLWDTIRSSQRDNTGALKNIKAKITEYHSQLAKEEDILKLTQETNELKDVLHSLYEVKGRYKGVASKKLPEQQLFGAIEKIVTKYDSLMNSIYDTCKVSIKIPTTDIDSAINLTNAQIDFYKKEKDNALESLSQVQTKLQSFKFDSNLTPDEVEHEVENRRSMMDSYRKTAGDYLELIPKILDTNDPKSIFNQLTKFRDYYNHDETREFEEHIVSFKMAQEESASFEAKFMASASKLKELRAKVDMTNQRLIDAKSHLEMLEKEPDHHCPNCKHVFKDNGADDRIQKMKEIISRLTTSLSDHESNYESYSLEHNAFEQQYLHYSAIRQHLANAYGVRAKIYQYYNHQYGDVNRLNYFHLLGTVTGIYNKLGHICSYYHILFELEDLEKSLAELKRGQSHEYLELKQKQQELALRIETIGNDKHELEKIQLKLNGLKQEYDAIKEQVEQFQVFHGKFMDYFENHDKLDYEAVCQEAIQTLTDTITAHEKVIQHQFGLKTLITSMEDNIQKIEISIRHHQRLMDILNPKDGLMAKALAGFVGTFIKEMNMIINQVWEYRLQLNTKDITSYMRDYKFPVFVGTDGYSLDVKETSLGQSEIIDMAFRLILMKYAKITPWVIYADEVGAALNPKFRANLFNLLKRLRDENKVEQLFIITHLNDVEQMFPNSQKLIF